MDDESGESMEPMDEVPPKEPGETESGASRGMYLMTRIAYLESQAGELRMLLVNRVHVTVFVNVPLKLLS